MTGFTNFKLNTGATVPSIALGTWESSPDEVYDAVIAALKAGYRHIDTAKIYGNEEPVGKAIRESGVPREDIFVTTKLWLRDFHDVPGALDGSLKRLGLDYIDLYLMHWPFAIHENGKVDESVSFKQAWDAMAKLPTSKTRAVGVSNFSIRVLTELLESNPAKIPAANQVELHVNLPQQKLVDFCNSKGIVVEAYCPLGRGKLDDPTIKKIAEKHSVGPANVVLSWGHLRNTLVLPKSVTPSRIEANLKYIKLDDEDIKALDGISKEEGLVRHCNQGESAGFNTFGDNDDSK